MWFVFPQVAGLGRSPTAVRYAVGSLDEARAVNLIGHENIVAIYDLNLLPVFTAMMEERSATRAAARLGMTQPALSNALSRLRATLQDPLFIRERYGIEDEATLRFFRVHESADVEHSAVCRELLRRILDQPYADQIPLGIAVTIEWSWLL